jgi:hypothetical protein
MYFSDMLVGPVIRRSEKNVIFFQLQLMLSS